MAAGEISAAGYILGLTGAVGAFIVNDRITQTMIGVRFRRRIATDISVIVEGYHAHYQELARLIERVEKTLAPDEPTRLEWVPSPIWENDYTLLDHVYQHSSHLRIDELRKCVEFYDTLGRLYEIRKAYNEAVRSAAVQTDGKELQIRYAYKRLFDLQSDYADVVRCGCAALRLLTNGHWFAWVNCKHFDKIAATYDSAHAPPDPAVLTSLLNGEMILLTYGAGFNHYWKILPGEVSDLRVLQASYDQSRNTHNARLSFVAGSGEKRLAVTGELEYSSSQGVAYHRGFTTSAVKKLGQW